MRNQQRVKAHEGWKGRRETGVLVYVASALGERDELTGDTEQPHRHVHEQREAESAAIRPGWSGAVVPRRWQSQWAAAAATAAAELVWFWRAGAVILGWRLVAGRAAATSGTNATTRPNAAAGFHATAGTNATAAEDRWLQSAIRDGEQFPQQPQTTGPEPVRLLYGWTAARKCNVYWLCST